jgi:hypothetical protein
LIELKREIERKIKISFSPPSEGERIILSDSLFENISRTQNVNIEKAWSKKNYFS